MGEHLLWYRKPANNWNEALPIGNGRLGAMIFGKPDQEIIELNEDSIWSGDQMNRDNPDAYANLHTFRQLVLEGKLDEAQELALTALSGVPDKMRVYQTAGMICVDTGHEEVSEYERKLDLKMAVATVKYCYQNTFFTREVFASNPDQAIVMHFTADGPKTINMRVHFYRDDIYDSVFAEDHDSIIATSRTGVPFANRLKAKVIGGSLTTIGEHIVIKDAKEVFLYYDARSEYREKDYLGAAKESLEKVGAKEYSDVWNSHIADYQSYYLRAGLVLTGEEKGKEITTDQRLKNLADGMEDTGLFELYYNFGRYLLISCSREHTLPANLQGIWNNSMCPPWGSKYTININTEMNYWPAEILNLSEMHMPLFDLLEKMHPNGIKTAWEMYRCKGFVAHHNTDLWGDCSPQDFWLPGTYWVLGGAWLCLDIWEHYEYTEDVDFLERMYPLLYDACLFFTEFLSEDKKGRLILSPTASPENRYRHESGQIGYLCPGCTMDGQILTELFNGFRKATDVLKKDPALSNQCMELLKRIPKPEIHSNGTIREWLEEYEELEPGHRHISHLFGLFPGKSITMEKTKELAVAARKTLERRLANGGGHTGWSRAWIINFWDYLWDGEEAFKNLKQLLISSTLPNLFDNHPPFQIDGNFGATAGIAHMLLQADGHHIHLLPALPKAFETGSFYGFKAPYNVEVSVDWKDGKLVRAELISKEQQEVEVEYQGRKKKVVLEKGSNQIFF